MKLSHVDVYVQYRPVLRDLDWQLRRGEHWAVYGANGAGKTTFLKLLYGDLSPAQVAKDALEGIERETFLILPHPQVLTYMRNKTENYDRWIGGMAKIQAKMRDEFGK